MSITLSESASLDVLDPTREVSLVVTYNTETGQFKVDDDATDQYFPDGCVKNLEDGTLETDQDALELVEEVTKELSSAFARLH